MYGENFEDTNASYIPLKTKRRRLYLKTQFVPRSEHFTFQLGYKNRSVYVKWAEIAVCSEKNTKRINTVWAECQF